MVLFINACARPQSRTFSLAERVVKKIGGSVEVLDLYDEDIAPLDHETLEKRDKAVQNSDFSDSMFRFARQFSDADEIVIAAPYWDLSFPAALKQYFEQINVSGITFKYTAAGFPVGLCRAEKLYYITTAGGNFFPEEYGYGYVKALAQNFYGIKDVELIKAKGLDIEGADEEKILHSCMENIVI